MPNPKAAYDKAPDPIVASGVAPRAPDGRMLFLKRQGGDYAGHWCFPGGCVEEGEDAPTAAHRELLEEAGHDLDRPMREIARMVRRGVDYTTHVADVADPFEPELNDEHSEFVWAMPDDAPAPLHPGVKALLAASEPDDWAPAASTADDRILALDRASVRTKDQDGRLNVETSHIAKACVSPYRGEEIPHWDDLGLDPHRVYQLLRDPDELAQSVPTWNNKPLLIVHRAQTADDHDKTITVGTIGSNAVWNAPYIDNCLSVWTKDGVDAVESKDQQELSPSYYYKADMTPGNFHGVRYDGVMRDIVCNHVALVPAGRQGPEVAVFDSAEGIKPMNTVNLSRKAIEVRGAIFAYLAPKLAADAKIDLSKPLLGMDRKNYADKKPAILAALKGAVSGKLAADATIDDLNLLLDKLDDAGLADPEDDTMVPAKEDTPTGDIDATEAAKAFLKGKLDPEDYAQFEKLLTSEPAPAPVPAPADPAEDENDEEPITQAAMDAAMKAAEKTAEDRTMRRMNAIQDALREVRPWVGELAMSFDSAAGVRRHVLKMLGVDGAADIHESALATLISAQPKPGARPTPTPAMDEAAAKSYAERFPNAARIHTY